jgi:hypothetical protein
VSRYYVTVMERYEVEAASEDEALERIDYGRLVDMSVDFEEVGS